MAKRNETITQTMMNFLDSVKLSRSESTYSTYRNAINSYKEVLEEKVFPPDTTSIVELNEGTITAFATALKRYAPATERLYLTAITQYFQYLAAENYLEVNLPRLRYLIRQRARIASIRLPQFPREQIEQILDYAQTLGGIPVENDSDKLRNLRDRAFLLVLADTGLRVHEACNLRRGDLDWNEGKAAVIGKGNKHAIVRFSIRSINAIRDYINTRSEIDGSSGRPLSSLPIFARHDRGAGKNTKPITPTTGRNIVSQRVKECLGEKAVGSITPHSFRHYFVTTVLRGSGGNLKLAQELARHKNISVTQRYAHLSNDELDRGYYDIFEQGQGK